MAHTSLLVIGAGPYGVAVGAFGAHGGFAIAAMAAGVMTVLAATGLRALRVPRRQAAAGQLPE